MLQILEFLFDDLTHFFGFLILWIILFWGVSNFSLVTINKKTYSIEPIDIEDTKDTKENEENNG
ncbi:MAG: hypothetical protein K6F00_08410 [Lachnospiraceae bacterium]|nr:hypothetical protein [Lachnospiraceae bacterium]